ncbi:serine/threonine-protein kinase 33 [Mugil cephalus]|uniref:serine/threonine-protein kinase 33 n=1 Tax=Mugil cephalus TaxID=48193 RepID=UPI001FB5B1E0|nr:serine/threonine-protein kinase 33 [Mugil cephalus]XP_047436865.1 serine/threonine-protein kinase 33 [Mugil cephalus]
MELTVKRLVNDADLRDIYEFGKKLGQGSFGVVYEATHIKTQTKWAIKEVCRPPAGSSKVQMLEHEINILKQVNHKHIIRLEAIYDTAMTIFLVTERCKGGELQQLLQQKKYFTENEAKNVICSLADAVAYLHKKDIVHRDLKLENILVKNCPKENDDKIDIKVTDFGLSVMRGGVGMEHMMTEACGTLTYMAPEMMSGRGYSHWCDEWSIGVIMYMLLCGEPPFVSKTKSGLLEEIMKESVLFTQTIWNQVSNSAKHILRSLLKVDPAYRISASQLLEVPWITGNTNESAVLSNVLDMMRDHRENRERTQSLEVLSLPSSEDNLEPLLVPQEVSTERTNSSCRNHAELSQELRNRNSHTSATCMKQSHAGVKASTQTSGKQHKPQDKKDTSTGKKLAPIQSKDDSQRLATSGKKGVIPANHHLVQRPTPVHNKTKTRDISRGKT